MGIYGRMAGLALRRPTLVPHLLGTAWAFRKRGWWRTLPFLPLPSRSYVRWRMETAYGDPEAIPTDDEMDRYLRWASRMRSGM